MTIEQAAAHVLEARHGLRFEGVSARRLERALRAAAEASGRTVGDQVALLAVDDAAVEDLLDRATLPETSWFRDPVAFSAILAHARGAAARAAAAGRTLRIWSAGCAHGQEPWSVAIGLREAGVEDFEVIATDISPASVAIARAGVYPARGLRGLSDPRRDRWLEPAGEGLWQVRDELRGHVTVVRHGLVEEVPPAPPGSCALVLCRNVLIYLTPRAVERALGRLSTALAPDGVLVLGAGEAVVRRIAGLRATPLGPAFAYVRDDKASPAPRAASAPLPPPAGRPAPAVPPAPPPVPAAGGAAPVPDAAATPGAAPVSPPEPTPFAARMAEGEAAAAARDHVAAAAAFRHAAALDPGAPLAHMGLGLALEALGDPGAARAFRAALSALQRPGAVLAEDLGGFHVDELVRLLARRVAGAAG